MGKYDKYVKAGGTGTPTIANAEKYEQYQRPQAEPEKENPFEKAGMFGLDILRNFNDTLTFGLYNRGLEATGIDTEADEKLAASDPYAGVIGDMAGYILPGLGASSLVGRAVPKLAGNTVKQIMGREAVASGGLSTVDDLIRTGTVDPVGVATDTALGGLLAGGFAGAGRIISPSARVRASGNSMTDADRIMTEYYMRQGEDLGVPLTIPEAANAANPTAAVPTQRLFDDALQAPKGSQAIQEFEATRAPKIAAAGRGVVDKVGPGADPAAVSAAADEAIARTKDMVRNSAQPYYDKADARNLPPSWVPKGASITAAKRKLLNDPEKMEFLRREMGLGKNDPIPENSVMFQDAVKKQLQVMGDVAQSSGKDNLLASLRFSAADDVTAAADRVAPDYATARGITEEGNSMVAALENGPLGRVSKQPSAKGQASTLFGVDNAVDANLSRRALAQLGAQDAGLPAGILANNLDSAISSNPSNWANTALPNQHSRGLALDVLPQGSPVGPTLEAAARVDPYTGTSLPGHDGGFFNKAQAAISNLGKGKIAKLLTEANTAKKLGKTGPVQRVATTSAIGLQQTTEKRKRKQRRN